MGSAETTGENRAIRAAEEAINSPLLNNQNIQGADKILLSIISGDQAELQMDELTEITDFMQDLAGDDAEVIFGHGVDSELNESIRVTIIATGFEEEEDQPELNELISPQQEENPALKIFDLNKDVQTSLFSSEPQEIKEDTFEEDFQLKMKSFSFEKPDRTTEIEQPINEEVDPFEREMRELFEESQRNKVAIDEPLEELDGMAHPPSKKILLMEQSEERRRRLDGIKTEESVDANSFKEKFEVPAYQRKKVSLKNVPTSSESLVSKYNLNDENQLGSNKFLHDRPD